MVLKIAILGARGIGKYHAKEFTHAGCKIISILGKTESSAKQTSQNLKEEFGIEAKPYFSIDELLKRSKIDAVSICTPPETHQDFIKKCLEKRLHVFCEKPLIINEQKKVYENTKELLRLAKKNKRILTVNTQWAAVLGKFGLSSRVRSLAIYMEPKETGKEMLSGHLPHFNSILVKLFPNGNITNIYFMKKGREEIILRFEYIVNQREKVDVEYSFKHNPHRPGNIEFVFNGQKFYREVGTGYKQSFKSNGRKIEIENPFKISILKFIKSVEGEGNQLIGEEEILESAKITDLILLEYGKF